MQRVKQFQNAPRLSLELTPLHYILFNLRIHETPKNLLEFIMNTLSMKLK